MMMPVGDDDDTAGDDDDDEVSELPQWLVDRPYLQNRSLWRQDIDRADPPLQRRLACVGVGNGRVFGILGNQHPTAGWHNIGGPTYQMTLKWFTDKTPAFLLRGQELEPQTESISRVRNGAVTIVETQTGPVEWTSVNFAPHYEADPRAETALVSVWIARNTGSQPLDDVALSIRSRMGRVNDGRLSESNLEGNHLDLVFLDATARAGEADHTLVANVGDLLPGQERVVTMLQVFTRNGVGVSSVVEALAQAGIDALLASTVDWWNDWASGLTTVDTPDEKFNDLMRGLAVAIKVNQAREGGVSQMSQYSHTWLRDTHGPSIYLPPLGKAHELKEMLDYLYAAAVIDGDFHNAHPIDYDVSNLPPEPDWDSLGERNGRERAEGPSMLVLEYENYYKATGDLSPVKERYGMLRHAIFGQRYWDGCLIPFSSDETFEDLMEGRVRRELLPDPDDTVLSFYSSLLLIRAATFLSESATAFGYEEDAILLAELAKTCVRAWKSSTGCRIWVTTRPKAMRSP